MEHRAYHMAMLYDFYGELLTDRQREFFDLYHQQDLSLAEIAEQYHISRQGVRDIILRAEHTMTEVENKTRLIQRFHRMQTELAALDQATEELALYAAAHDQEGRLSGIVQTIRNHTARLKQE